MPHLSFEELSQVSGVPTATLNRRLKFIKEHDAVFYKRMLQTQGRTKLYDSDEMLGKLRDWKSYSESLTTATAVVELDQKTAPSPKSPPPPPKTTSRTASPRRVTLSPKAQQLDPERQKKLTELLETPLVMVKPDADTLRLFNSITDPVIKGRVEVAILICTEYGRGESTLEQCCDAQGVAIRTFRNWTYAHTEVAALYKRARAKARRAKAQVIGDAAQHALLRLVDGEEWDEVTIIYQQYLQPDGTIKEVPVSSRTTRKKVGPSVPATIFALTNAMARLYQNKFHQDLGPTPDQVKRDEIDKMTPTERNEAMMEVFKQQALALGWTPPAAE